MSSNLLEVGMKIFSLGIRSSFLLFKRWAVLLTLFLFLFHGVGLCISGKGQFWDWQILGISTSSSQRIWIYSGTDSTAHMSGPNNSIDGNMISGSLHVGFADTASQSTSAYHADSSGVTAEAIGFPKRITSNDNTVTITTTGEGQHYNVDLHAAGGGSGGDPFSKNTSLGSWIYTVPFISTTVNSIGISSAALTGEFDAGGIGTNYATIIVKNHDGISFTPTVTGSYGGGSYQVITTYDMQSIQFQSIYYDFQSTLNTIGVASSWGFSSSGTIGYFTPSYDSTLYFTQSGTVGIPASITTYWTSTTINGVTGFLIWKTFLGQGSGVIPPGIDSITTYSNYNLLVVTTTYGYMSSNLGIFKSVSGDTGTFTVLNGSASGLLGGTYTNFTVWTSLTSFVAYSLASGNNNFSVVTVNNIIYFGTAGGQSFPAFNSIGEKIQLYGTPGIPNTTDYAIGVEPGYTWFNAPGGYKYYYNGNYLGGWLNNGYGDWTAARSISAPNINTNNLNVISITALNLYGLATGAINSDTANFAITGNFLNNNANDIGSGNYLFSGQSTVFRSTYWGTTAVVIDASYPGNIPYNGSAGMSIISGHGGAIGMAGIVGLDGGVGLDIISGNGGSAGIDFTLYGGDGGNGISINAGNGGAGSITNGMGGKGITVSAGTSGNGVTVADAIDAHGIVDIVGSLNVINSNTTSSILGFNDYGAFGYNLPALKLYGGNGSYAGSVTNGKEGLDVYGGVGGVGGTGIFGGNGGEGIIVYGGYGGSTLIHGNGSGNGGTGIIVYGGWDGYTTFMSNAITAYSDVCVIGNMNWSGSGHGSADTALFCATVPQATTALHLQANESPAFSSPTASSFRAIFAMSSQTGLYDYSTSVNYIGDTATYNSASVLNFTSTTTHAPGYFDYGSSSTNSTIILGAGASIVQASSPTPDNWNIPFLFYAKSTGTLQIGITPDYIKVSNTGQALIMPILVPSVRYNRTVSIVSASVTLEQQAGASSSLVTTFFSMYTSAVSGGDTTCPVYSVVTSVYGLGGGALSHVTLWFLTSPITMNPGVSLSVSMVNGWYQDGASAYEFETVYWNKP